MFYVLFGIVMAPAGPHRTETATYLLATMACYGVMGVAMFSFGVGIAMERGQGWLQVKRASPMPLPAYFLAKIANALVFAAVISLVLLAVGSAFGGVRLSFLKAAELIAHPGRRIYPLQRDGVGLGLFRQAELGSRDGESGVSADVVLLGIVDPDLHAAACAAEGGTRSATVSHEPAGVERHRCQPESDASMGSRAGADRSDAFVPGHRDLRLLAR